MSRLSHPGMSLPRPFLFLICGMMLVAHWTSVQSWIQMFLNPPLEAVPSLMWLQFEARRQLDRVVVRVDVAVLHQHVLRVDVDAVVVPVGERADGHAPRHHVLALLEVARPARRVAERHPFHAHALRAVEHHVPPASRLVVALGARDRPAAPVDRTLADEGDVGGPVGADHGMRGARGVRAAGHVRVVRLVRRGEKRRALPELQRHAALQEDARHGVVAGLERHRAAPGGGRRVDSALDVARDAVRADLRARARDQAAKSQPCQNFEVRQHLQTVLPEHDERADGDDPVGFLRRAQGHARGGCVIAQKPPCGAVHEIARPVQHLGL